MCCIFDIKNLCRIFCAAHFLLQMLYCVSCPAYLFLLDLRCTFSVALLLQDILCWETIAIQFVVLMWKSFCFMFCFAFSCAKHIGPKHFVLKFVLSHILCYKFYSSHFLQILYCTPHATHLCGKCCATYVCCKFITANFVFLYFVLHILGCKKCLAYFGLQNTSCTFWVAKYVLHILGCKICLAHFVPQFIHVTNTTFTLNSVH